MPEPFRVGVLVSGSGTTLQSLIDAGAKGGARFRIVQVVSSKPDAPALDRAKRAGIPARVVTQGDDGREARDRRLADVVAKTRPGLIVLAGWMSILTSTFLDRFPDRVINLHPSLLPAFPGMRPIPDALEWGVRYTGVTVHYAEEVVDGGPPILQEPVPVLYGDTQESLRERIREVEHRLVPQAVGLFAEGRVTRDPTRRRQVLIRDGGPE